MTGGKAAAKLCHAGAYCPARRRTCPVRCLGPRVTPQRRRVPCNSLCSCVLKTMPLTDKVSKQACHSDNHQLLQFPPECVCSSRSCDDVDTDAS